VVEPVEDVLKELISILFADIRKQTKIIACLIPLFFDLFFGIPRKIVLPQIVNHSPATLTEEPIAIAFPCPERQTTGRIARNTDFRTNVEGVDPRFNVCNDLAEILVEQSRAGAGKRHWQKLTKVENEVVDLVLSKVPNERRDVLHQILADLTEKHTRNRGNPDFGDAQTFAKSDHGAGSVDVLAGTERVTKIARVHSDQLTAADCHGSRDKLASGIGFSNEIGFGHSFQDEWFEMRKERVTHCARRRSGVT
jgi:hypothetical protein